MNCYEIKIRVAVQYLDGDTRYHYMDSRCDCWTVRDFVDAYAYAWTSSEDRALDLVNTLDFEQGSSGFDVTGYEIEGVSICCVDESVDEESIELEYMGDPFSD